MDLAETVRQLVLQMGESCEFDFVSMTRAVKDSLTQIGNHNSKSEVSIQSASALNI